MRSVQSCRGSLRVTPKFSSGTQGRGDVAYLGWKGGHVRIRDR